MANKVLCVHNDSAKIANVNMDHVMYIVDDPEEVRIRLHESCDNVDYKCTSESVCNILKEMYNIDVNRYECTVKPKCCYVMINGLELMILKKMGL